MDNETSPTDHQLISRYNLRKRKYKQVTQNQAQQPLENITFHQLIIDETTPVSLEGIVAYYFALI